MIQHAVSEGLLLLRSRLLLSLCLAVSLAVPLCVGAIIAATTMWLRPLVAGAPAAVVVPVLLHPQMDSSQRASWLAEVRESHPSWKVREVAADELADRLASWFPYLADLLGEDGAGLLPPLVEVETLDPEAVGSLLTSPRVIAVGPRSSLLQLIGRSARGLAVWLAGCALALLVSAGLLSAVWVHLELFRHGDEITVMRLVGATEGTVQGPFVVAVAVPGLVGGFLAALATVAAGSAISRLATGIGLPPVGTPWWLGVACLLCGIGLPVSAALWTLGRHGHLAREV